MTKKAKRKTAPRRKATGKRAALPPRSPLTEAELRDLYGEQAPLVAMKLLIEADPAATVHRVREALRAAGAVAKANRPPPCEPPPVERARHWHWIDVNVAMPDGSSQRRVACSEWVQDQWWLGGRPRTPAQAAELGWRYIGPAVEPFERVHEGQASSPEARCVPPNLPLPTGMHWLVDGEGKQVKACWRNGPQAWLVGDIPGQLTPEEVHQRGFRYLAALPN